MSAGVSGEAASRQSDDNEFTVQLPLRDCLLPWLDVFSRCSTEWGLVTDVREDGSTYKRHGIVVQLHANITKVAEAFDFTLDWKMRRIRQAIDLVKLALAVNPHSLIPLMLRRSRNENTEASVDGIDGELDMERLQVLTHGDAPFEMRLCLEIRTKKMQFDWAFKRRFISMFDNENVKRAPTSASGVRNCLVEVVRATQSPSRLISVPVQTTLVVEPLIYGREDVKMNEERCQAFFSSWAATIEALHLYQTRRARKWRVDKNLAPLEIVQIKFDLGAVPITSPVLEAVRESMGKGIPCSGVNLDLDWKYTSCKEDELDAFLNAIVDQTQGPILISTGALSNEDDEELEYYDCSDVILMILRCIGRLRHDITLDFSGLFSSCTTTTHQNAAIWGLFEHICTREFATCPSVEDCELDSQVVGRLARLMRQYLKQSADQFPLQKRRLHSLDWSPRVEGSTSLVQVLLRALDDVEKVELVPFDEEFTENDMKTMLRYPSLRSLIVGRPDLSTMDIFHTSTKHTPALECLHLDGLSLDDSGSMIRFLKSLDPSGANPSALSISLQELCIAEGDNSGDEAMDPSDPNCVRRAINHPAAGKTLRKVLATNRVLQNVNFIGDFSQYPARLVTTQPKRSSRRGHIPASEAVRRSDLSKARHAAFLSAVREGRVSVLRCLDSHVIRLIFDFADPHVYRCIRI